MLKNCSKVQSGIKCIEFGISFNSNKQVKYSSLTPMNINRNERKENDRKESTVESLLFGLEDEKMNTVRVH